MFQILLAVIFLVGAIYGLAGYEYSFPSRHFGRPTTISGASAIWVILACFSAAAASLLAGLQLCDKHPIYAKVQSGLVFVAVLAMGFGFVLSA